MTAAPKRSPMLTTSEVAARLAVSPKTVRRWVERGYLPNAVQPPGGHVRIPESDVEAMLAKWRAV